MYSENILQSILRSYYLRKSCVVSFAFSVAQKNRNKTLFIHKIIIPFFQK